MINLLPPETRTNMMYARRNTILLHWVIAFAFVLMGVGVIVGIGYIYLGHATKNYSKTLEAAKQNLAVQNIEQTQKQIESISNNTKLATQVLSREILFSKLLRQLGAILPANTALKQLQIDNLQGGLSLSATASNINAATQIQVNLQDPKNKIFEKADIENITCGTSTAESIYPCTVQIRALFTANNPFLYITPTTPGTTAR